MDEPLLPDYFPALPWTLIIDDPAEDQEYRDLGHEFVLHFEPEEERYCVFLFKDAVQAQRLKQEYDRSNSRGKVARVVALDPRAIGEQFGVRYTDETGRTTNMPIRDYWRRMEMRNEFRRED